MNSISQETPAEAVQSESGRASEPGRAKVSRLRLDRAQTDHVAISEADQIAHWGNLRRLRLDAATLPRNHLHVDSDDSDIVARFDFLRTMVSGAMQEHGILRLGVCGATAGCGASFVAANLALSMARRPSSRIILADMNLRQPGLADLFGTTAPGPLGDVLAGHQPALDQLRLARDNLALLLNSQPVQNSAELLQEPSAGQALREIRDHYGPTAEIYDMAPVLEGDQALALLPELDGVLLVADGTTTTAADMKAADRILQGRSRLVGLVLNRGDVSPPFHEMLANFLARTFGRRKKV